MERVGIAILYTKGMNLNFLIPLGGLVGKCTIWFGIGERKYHIRIETKMLLFQSSGFRSETL